MRAGGSKGGDGRRTISRGKRTPNVRLKSNLTDANVKDTGPDEDSFASLVKKADGVRTGIRARVGLILSARNDKLALDTWNSMDDDDVEYDEHNRYFDPDALPKYEDMDYDNNPVLLPSKMGEFKSLKANVKSASLIVTPFQQFGITESKDSIDSLLEEGEGPLSDSLGTLYEDDELEESNGPAAVDNILQSDNPYYERVDSKIVTTEDLHFIDGLKKHISMADIPLVQPEHHRAPNDLIQQGLLSGGDIKKYFGPDSRNLFYDTYQSLAKTAQICSGGIDELARYIADPDGHNPLIESAKVMVADGVITPRRTDNPPSARGNPPPTRDNPPSSRDNPPSSRDNPLSARGNPPEDAEAVEQAKPRGSHTLLMVRQSTYLESEEKEETDNAVQGETQDFRQQGGDDIEGITNERGELLETVDSSFNDAQLDRLLGDAVDDAAEEGLREELLDEELNTDTDGPDAERPLRLAEGEVLVDRTDTLLDMEAEVKRLDAEEDDEEYDMFETEIEVYPCAVHGCNVPAQFYCSGCHNETYCSHEHQFVHWEAHSAVCKHNNTQRTARSAMTSARIDTARAKPQTEEEAYIDEIPSLSTYRPQSPRATFILGLMKLGVAPRAVAMLRKSMTSTLNICNMGLGDGMAEAFSSSVHRLPGIRGLNLSNNSLTDKGMTTIIKNLGKVSALEDLDLSSNVVGKKAAQALADYLASDTCRVRRLKLTHANVDDKECDRFVSALMKNNYLEELDLSHNLLGKSENLNEVNADFTTAGESLALLLKSSNAKLKRLVLRWNMMRMGGAIALCGSLKLNQSLVHLDLAFNKIGTAAAVELGASLVNEGFSLEYLNLQSNCIDGRAAIAIIIGAKYSGIKDLVLDDNPIGEQAARLLLQTVRDYGDRLNISCKSCDGIFHYADTLIDFGHIKGSYTLNCQDSYERMLAYELLDIIPRSNLHAIQEVMLSDGKALVLPLCRTKKKFNIHDPALEEIKRLKYLSEFQSIEVHSHVLRIFHAFDKNKKGYLFDRDLKHLLMKLGLHYNGIEVKDFIRMFDTNGNGVIEIGELEQFLRHLGRYCVKLLKSLSSTSNIEDIKSALQSMVQSGVTTVMIKIAEKWDFSIDHDHHITSSTQLKYMIAAADQSLNPVRMMEYATEAVGTILYYNEAKEFMSYFMTIDTEVLGLTYVLPCMEATDDALNLVKKYLDMNKSKRKLLSNALGNAYNVCTGNYNGSYFIDLSKPMDRIAMRKLLIASSKYAEFSQRKQLFDISDTGDRSSFRNAYFYQHYAFVNNVFTEFEPSAEGEVSKHTNQHVVRLDTILAFFKACDGIPDKGKIDFDFSAITNIDTFYHYKGISDAKFLRYLTEGNLCQNSDLKNMKNKMAKYDVSALSHNYDDLTNLLNPDRQLSEMDAVKHLRHMIKYKEHRRAEVIDKRIFRPPEHEDDLISASSLDEASAQLPDDISGQFSVDSTDDVSAKGKTEPLIMESSTLAPTLLPSPVRQDQNMPAIKPNFLANYSKLSYGEMLGVSALASSGKARAERIQKGEIDESVLTIQEAIKRAWKDPNCSPVWKCQLVFEYLSIQLFHRSIFVRQLLILIDILEEIDVPMNCLYFPSYRVELLVNFYPKVIDTHNMHLVYSRLQPVDQAAFVFRVGLMRTFNVFKPEGHYFLDISHREQRSIFKMILFLYKLDSSTHSLTGDYTLTGRSEDMHRLEINPNYWHKDGLYENAIYKLSFLPKNIQACKAWLKSIKKRLVSRYKLLACGSLNQKLLHDDIMAGKVIGDDVNCLLNEPVNSVDEVNAMLADSGIEWRFV